MNQSVLFSGKQLTFLVFLFKITQMSGLAYTQHDSP